MLRYLLSIVIFCSLNTFSYSQCSICDVTVTVPDASNYTPGNNKTLCITGSGEFTGTISLDNANSTLCIDEDVVFKGNLNINKSSAIINNYGSLEIGGFSYKATFNNYGTMQISGGMTVQNSGVFNNYNTTFGAVEINGDLNVDSGGNLNTDGGIVVNGSFKADNGSDVILNGAGLQISGTLIVNTGSDITSSGSGSGCSGITYGSIVLNSKNSLHDVDVCSSSDPESTNDVDFESSVTRCSCSLLPVEFISYSTNADYDKNAIKIMWSTSTEINSFSYEIEKSSDGYEFNKIGEVFAVGNSDLATFYNFYDAAPLFGKQYYRIKQFDADGNYFYTNIMVQFYENRTASDGMLASIEEKQLQLSFNKFMETGSLEIIGTGGKLFLQSEIEINDYQHKLQLNQHLSAGIYIVRFRNLKNYWVKKVLVK